MPTHRQCQLKPGEDVTTSDKIVTVACCFNNLCVSVVPTDLVMMM